MTPLKVRKEPAPELKLDLKVAQPFRLRANRSSKPNSSVSSPGSSFLAEAKDIKKSTFHKRDFTDSAKLDIPLSRPSIDTSEILSPSESSKLSEKSRRKVASTSKNLG